MEYEAPEQWLSLPIFVALHRSLRDNRRQQSSAETKGSLSALKHELIGHLKPTPCEQADLCNTVDECVAFLEGNASLLSALIHTLEYFDGGRGPYAQQVSLLSKPHLAYLPSVLAEHSVWFKSCKTHIRVN